MIILMSFIDVLFGCYYFMLYLCIHVKDVCYLFAGMLLFIGFPAQNCFMGWNYRVLAYEVGKHVV
jgi:hypothetical protein